jgi:hypothetical protein
MGTDNGRTVFRHLWRILNWGIIVYAFWGGYASIAPDKLSHTNFSPVLCLVILLIAPVFVFGSVAFSVHYWKPDPLARPSWDRNPFNWWGDPLQSLFVLTCTMVAVDIGSAFRRPLFGSIGFWALGVYCSFTVGLLIGQILVYRTYRERIAPTS